jgi:hypothetical protein
MMPVAVAAHTLVFTPTQSIGTHLWRNPTPVVIEYGGATDQLSEFVNPGLGIFVPYGTNPDHVTGYQDGLINVSGLNSNGVLLIPSVGDYSSLDVNGFFVDNISGFNEIAVSGNIEGFASDNVTPCGTFTYGGPFDGGCEAAGFWTLDGTPIDAPEPSSLVLALIPFGLLLRARRISGLSGMPAMVPEHG